MIFVLSLYPLLVCLSNVAVTVLRNQTVTENLRVSVCVNVEGGVN